MPPENNGSLETLVNTVGEISDQVVVLVREEIELAKAEVTAKATSIARGAIAVIIGAMFGFFALMFGLFTLANGLNSLLSSVWAGYAITFALLLLLTIFVFLFARSKLQVGAPTPDMAIDEAKRIRATVTEKAELGAGGSSALDAPEKREVGR